MIYDELRASQSSGLSNQCDVQVIITEPKSSDVDTIQYQRPAYFAVVLIMAMTAIFVFLPMIVATISASDVMMSKMVNPCQDPCKFTLVESIPQNLTYPPDAPDHPFTYSWWKKLIQSANHSIDIASFYWTLRGSDVYQDPSDWEGEDIYKSLLRAGTVDRIKIRIAQSQATESQQDYDTRDLQKLSAADVRSLNFTHWFGGGVLHTNFWIIDKRHVYIGSANMDWRSLTQVKELGVVVSDCPCLAQDLQKSFDVYWYLGQPGADIPYKWSRDLHTEYNNVTPMAVSLNGRPASVYLSSSPPPFCPYGRTSDIDAVLDVIYAAEKYIHIAVMDYYPLTIYTNPNRYWPVIDEALRHVALEKHVQVRVMASCWKYSRQDLPNYLLSLAQLNNGNGAKVEVKLFHVPSTPAQEKIPFARVNHNKYMVTDNTAYIGTSNWSGDYFTQTAGVAIIVNQTNYTDTNSTQTLQQQLAAVFERDWNSSYAHSIQSTLEQCQISDEATDYSRPFFS